MRILNFGSLNIDYVYEVDHIVRPGETIAGGNYSTFPGGKGANQSTAIARAGGEVWHAGKIGVDGRWLLDVLKESGVHTDWVKIYEGTTGHALIQVDRQGENAIVLFGGGNRAIEAEDIADVFSGFDAGDYLVLQNEISELPRIIDAAVEAGLRICFNPAPFSDSVRDLPLGKIDILILNETEARGLSAESGPLDILARRLAGEYPGSEIVITAGADGAHFARSGEYAFCESTRVKAVDTTAAGDTFLGYYLVARTEGASPELAMRRASAAAAITVSRAGAISSIPHASEVAAAMDLSGRKDG